MGFEIAREESVQDVIGKLKSGVNSTIGTGSETALNTMLDELKARVDFFTDEVSCYDTKPRGELTYLYNGDQRNVTTTAYETLETFTADKAGLYRFAANVKMVTSGSYSYAVTLAFFVNGTEMGTATTKYEYYTEMEWFGQLSAGDVVEVKGEAYSKAYTFACNRIGYECWGNDGNNACTVVAASTTASFTAKRTGTVLVVLFGYASGSSTKNYIGVNGSYIYYPKGGTEDVGIYCYINGSKKWVNKWTVLPLNVSAGTTYSIYDNGGSAMAIIGTERTYKAVKVIKSKQSGVITLPTTTAVTAYLAEVNPNKCVVLAEGASFTLGSDCIVFNKTDTAKTISWQVIEFY